MIGRWFGSGGLCGEAVSLKRTFRLALVFARMGWAVNPTSSGGLRVHFRKPLPLLGLRAGVRRSSMR